MDKNITRNGFARVRLIVYVIKSYSGFGECESNENIHFDCMHFMHLFQLFVYIKENRIKKKSKMSICIKERKHI